MSEVEKDAPEASVSGKDPNKSQNHSLSFGSLLAEEVSDYASTNRLPPSFAFLRCLDKIQIICL